LNIQYKFNEELAMNIHFDNDERSNLFSLIM